jgi:hypothetical protein
LAGGALGQAIGAIGANGGADAVLAGTFDLDREEPIPEALDILRVLKLPDDHTPMPNAKVSTESFRASVKSNKEKTAASPSGRHPGHYWSAL